MRISTDEGERWSEPQPVGAAPGYFVLNNDRVIQLKDGRLVVPLAFHRARASDPKNYRSLDMRAIALWYLSDDEGKSWREADTWWALPARTGTGLQEPGVVELADGRLFSQLQPGDRVRVEQSSARFKLITGHGHGYYRTLREKLGWGGQLKNMMKM